MIDFKPKVIIDRKNGGVEQILDEIKSSFNPDVSGWVESLINDKYNSNAYQAVAEKIIEIGWYGVAWEKREENEGQQGTVAFYLFKNEETFENWKKDLNVEKNEVVYHVNTKYNPPECN